LAKQQLSAYRARGRTILLSSELAADHDGLCDRIAILHRGRLVEVGAPDDLRVRHGAPTLASAFVAATAAPHASVGGVVRPRQAPQDPSAA
jgi:ABC-type multidrug transport system ATPase subunit